MTTLREAAQQALQALEYAQQNRECPSTTRQAITDLRAALAQEQAEPIAWLQPRTVDGYSRPDLGYETCSKSDYGAFPVYRAPPRCPNCASLEAQNAELDRKLAEMERAHGIIESEIKVDSHQTLNDRAMAQAYESGYKAGVAHEREACAKVCESRFMGDLTREDMEARRCAAAIRARGEMP